MRQKKPAQGLARGWDGGYRMQRARCKPHSEVVDDGAWRLWDRVALGPIMPHGQSPAATGWRVPPRGSPSMCQGLSLLGPWQGGLCCLAPALSLVCCPPVPLAGSKRPLSPPVGRRQPLASGTPLPCFPSPFVCLRRTCKSRSGGERAMPGVGGPAGAGGTQGCAWCPHCRGDVSLASSVPRRPSPCIGPREGPRPSPGPGTDRGLFLPL